MTEIKIEKTKENLTKYEIARILGARSLQLSMDAPILLKMSKEELEKLNYDTLKIAEKEFEAGVLPITVQRPFPLKSEKTIKKLSEEEIKEILKKKAEREKKELEELEKKRAQEEEEIKESEIMEIAKPEDEVEEEEEEIEEGI